MIPPVFKCKSVPTEAEIVIGSIMAEKMRAEGHMRGLPANNTKTEPPYLSEVRQLVGLQGKTQLEAAESLKISPSMVARICAQNGIRRAA